MDNICPENVECVDKNTLPSTVQMVKNLLNDGSKIVKNAIEGNKSLVDDDIRVFRWTTCQQCPRLQNDRCLECGCFMKVKVAFSTSVCPIGKW